MLNTVVFDRKLNIEKTPCVLLIGGFDGLHVGHKKLLARAKAYGLPVGITTIVGCKRGSGLFTLEERRRIWEKAGFAFVCEMQFSKIKDTAWEDFARLLTDTYNVKAFVCGEDFRFGKGAEGTPEKLQTATGINVDVEDILTWEGNKISTTTIKGYLVDGNVQKANQLLGDNFFVQGEVVQDRKVGRTLGFPTANMMYPQDKFALKKGVYETKVIYQGNTYKGITNYGARPTFDNGQVCIETYLDGFNGNLYGETLQIQFVRFLREIKTFDDAEALKKQLGEDIRSVREND